MRVLAGPIVRQQNVLIVGLLLALAAGAWIILVEQSRQMMPGMAMSPTMGMAAPAFLGIWVVMMVATMFPSAAPMILTYSRAAGSRSGSSYAPTWLFVSSYLAVWAFLGLAAYLFALGGQYLQQQAMWLMDNSSRFGGLLLVAAGVYQVSPLKHLCLSKCRSPLDFLMTNWRPGYRGAFRLGVSHALFCAGCCWLLFAILFPLGMTNIAAMAAVTALIFAEKVLPAARQVSFVAAAALVVYGCLVLASPAMLPG
ncbi:MAG: DUF2182 domain-containing protein [Chloroflexota bacterium]